ncbi:hypothetical protein CJ030_MR8G027627 [Morella rubra]|uniref:Uncharacterized protein n=1 Tax=Morella rubra TaxID=262757 RepID=A0A6A1UVX5_9ROSI|nr:hypothetical protein CJ030_MR8G027627 [Morella rubra]
MVGRKAVKKQGTKKTSRTTQANLQKGRHVIVLGVARAGQRRLDWTRDGLLELLISSLLRVATNVCLKR